MTAKLDLALENCLARVETGELGVEECLALYPELSAELGPMLAAAIKMSALKDLKVRPEFRARNRALLVGHLGARPRRKSGRGRSLALRYSAGFAALTLAFVTGGTALAQGALPGDTLYEWKLASERSWRSVQQNRVEADLALADRRVNELDAIQGFTNLELIGMGEYVDLLLELRADVDANPEYTQWVNEILVAHKAFLSDFFANSKAELPNPDDLFLAIPLPPENNDEESQTDSTLDLPLVVPPPVKKENEAGEGGSDTKEGVLEKVLDELLGLP